MTTRCTSGRGPTLHAHGGVEMVGDGGRDGGRGSRKQTLKGGAELVMEGHHRDVVRLHAEGVLELVRDEPHRNERADDERGDDDCERDSRGVLGRLRRVHLYMGGAGCMH